MNNDIAISNLMNQINQLSEKVNVDNLISNIDSVNNSNVKKDSESFSELMADTLQEINKQQRKASDMGTEYQLGNKEIDTAELMIQIQKSRVAFEALNQFRNQAVSAYQDIMNMQV